MKNRFASLLFACLATFSSVCSHADTLTMKADYWMPFNGDGKSETGYMLDIAKAVFEPKGIKIVYSTTPWEKALSEGRSGKCNAIIGADHTEVPDFVFPAEEQGVCIQLFCVKSGSPWRYAGTQSLKTIKLGVIKDYTYFDELDAYLKTNPKDVVYGTGDNPLESNLTRLVQGDLGAVVDDRSVIKYTIAKMGLQGKVAIAGTTSDAARASKIYIAFSPKNPRSAEYAKLLSDGMVALRKSGELQKILAKYGLTDWR